MSLLAVYFYYRLQRFTPRRRWYAFIGTLTVALISGYEVFLPGRWDVATFFFSYTMIGVLPILYVFWKVTRHTRVSLLYPNGKLGVQWGRAYANSDVLYPDYPGEKSHLLRRRTSRS